MGAKLTSEEVELYRRTDEVLHYLWDPIEVSGIPATRDEYEYHVPKVVTLLRQGSPAQEVAEYLVNVERDNMGLEPDPTKALRIAGILIEYRTWIAARPSRRES